MENEYPIAALLAAAQQQFDSLVRRGAFKPCERFVCRDADYEDRVQEGLGAAWRWYSQQVALGNEPDVALAVHVVHLRTVDRSRRFVSHGRRSCLDVYDASERQGHGVELRRLDGVHDDDDDDDDGRHEQDPSLGLARIGVNNPETNLVSALDLTSWCSTLASADRELLALRAAGHGLEEIGKATGRSVAGAFRRARQLGFELADRAGLEVLATRGRRPSHASRVQ